MFCCSWRERKANENVKGPPHFYGVENISTWALYSLVGCERTLESLLYLEGESKGWMYVMEWIKIFTSPPHNTKCLQSQFITKTWEFPSNYSFLRGTTIKWVRKKCQREHKWNLLLMNIKLILPTIIYNKKMKKPSEIKELMQQSCHLIESKRYPLVFGNKTKTRLHQTSCRHFSGSFVTMWLKIEMSSSRQKKIPRSH